MQLKYAQPSRKASTPALHTVKYATRQAFYEHDPEPLLRHLIARYGVVYLYSLLHGLPDGAFLRQRLDDRTQSKGSRRGARR